MGGVVESAKIRLLPETLANQIAAGEVVQRPASVVKELLENSVDAGAQHIQLLIKNAGKQLVQAIDDGVGMNAQDARMCFERHATSKIRSSNDLFAIKTLGFRGEALASIAAVSQVELLSRQKGASEGLKIQVNGGQFQHQEPYQCLEGTSISVSNLFYNVPARRKFLKSDSAELRKILDEFHRVALSNPDIAFTFIENSTVKYQIAAEKLAQRIVSLFGSELKSKLVPCSQETPLAKLRGYIGVPDMARRSKSFYFLFVNGRFVRDAYLHHAVRLAYENLIPKDEHPFYVLFLETDPSNVDVNVHPTKTEVKFEDEHALHGFLKSAVRHSINAHNLMPSIDFATNVGDEVFLSLRKTSRETSGYNQESSTIQEKYDPSFQRLNAPFHGNRIPSERYLENHQAFFQKQEVEQEDSEDWSHTLQQLREASSPEADSSYSLQLDLSSVLVCGNLAICKGKGTELIVADLERASERIYYEQFLQSLSKQSSESQQLLFSEVIQLPAMDVQRLQELSAYLEKIGFCMDFISVNEIKIQGVPLFINPAQIKNTLIALASMEVREEIPDFADSLAKFLSKKSAQLSHHPHKEEASSILAEVLQCSIIGFSPEGKKIFSFITNEALNILLR